MKRISLEFIAGLITLLIIAHPFILVYSLFDLKPSEIIPAGAIAIAVESLLFLVGVLMCFIGSIVRKDVLGIK